MSGRGRQVRRGLCLAAAAAALLGLPGAARGQVLLTQEEALRLAFPLPAEIERRTAYLDEEQLARFERESGVDARSSIVTYYVGSEATGPVGVAYFDVHRVRTLPEVLMVVVSPEAQVARIEILRFAEPREYIAPDGWLERFAGRRLAGDLEEKGAVAGMTGATLTSRAVTDAVRRVLALHAFIAPLAATDATGPAGPEGPEAP